MACCTSYLIIGHLCDSIKNGVPRLIQRLDDFDSGIRQAVANAMAELAKNGLLIPRSSLSVSHIPGPR
jgi:hypothetical protein